MSQILESLKSKCNRESTRNNYHGIWRSFNNFVIKLDRKPNTWEERASLFGAYLINVKGIQSSTLKSYISAIKAVLTEDGYIWNNDKILLNTLVRACKIENDHVKTRLPIQLGLLEIILFEIQRYFSHQPYLETLYLSMFSVAYYGLFRVGELASGNHPVKARNVHIAKNKNKMMFILYSSKTHSEGSKPQKIKITDKANNRKESMCFSKRFFCPFRLSREYLAIRGSIKNDNDPFYVHHDNSPVTPEQARNVLTRSLKAINLNSALYNFQSFRIGRATDMVQKFDYTIEQTKSAGRWRSNTVFKYIRSFEF